jgi:Domain of unknown function (DUF4062)
VTPLIRTPDQRLRVFVSSTLQELAEERMATKEAIQRIRLTPVMFEMGARPHPPRDLYRAYLAQSDVFIGIYGIQTDVVLGERPSDQRGDFLERREDRLFLAVRMPLQDLVEEAESLDRGLQPRLALGSPERSDVDRGHVGAERVVDCCDGIDRYCHVGLLR